ncbi:proteobacterial dedicated sortase system histidine kinase [Teredinibacter sp. KSP-S5-2]|uniref:proteobacterial dedicated sortase system histidine kinase n=1 Tax=Teredinibacter sp. KSP-S5-2 TaxID=3034506 RepID=UPI0029341179|nr:proteobacterial dedicated sortase system histidine kinase [Teredinibacter sp. KSP-S5-2]WNO09780.1 proteobacterial dedicated sortase system histidine kinase [Teredinibacter sp. KSP-S5-2]
MRLKKQLLLVSLVTLSLPWVGCQYIQEMDSALRKGQTDALVATAKAVSARIGNDPQLIQTIDAYATPGSTPVVAHALNIKPIKDGYADEWITANYDFQPLQEDMEIVAGIYRNELYLFLRVTTENIHYYTPALSRPTLADTIQLNLNSNTGDQRDIALYASGEGQIHAARQLSASNFAIEHQIKGYWLEWQNGFQVELSLPLSWAQQAFTIQYKPSPKKSANEQVQTALVPATLTPLIYFSDPLAKQLMIFQRQGVRLTLTTPESWIIAADGDLQDQATETLSKQHGLLRWIYKLALTSGHYPELPLVNKTGKIDTTEFQQTVQGEHSIGWYTKGNKESVRVSYPIYAVNETPKRIVGTLIADQGSDSLTSMTNSAFNRLLFYSVIASLSVITILIFYASWLSFRIQKLSAAATTAISDSGKINENFPVYSTQDEIGDLSRGYAQLLARLQEYTNYLRTLSSKLSHELRTPLAIVRSSLDNLEYENIPDQARTYAERAKEGTTRLSNILNAMSAASRVEQAIGAAEQENIPCDQLLQNLTEAYRDVYQHVIFSLNVRSEPEKLVVWGSGELLVQMLDKLVDNAADFCPEKGKIELGLYRHNNDVVFTVHNEGPPLPSHMHGQLFDSMVSVRDKDIPDNEGHHLGLGLYIVRLISDFHRGEVQGYNVPDHSGVIFEVRIPAKS